jgi:hypothetical protein
MSTERIPPTVVQRRLVNVGMFIQFHLAALGHLFFWCVVGYNFIVMGDGFAAGIFFWFVIPFSLSFLVVIYITFRRLLAEDGFGSALITMITFDVFHAGFMGFLVLVTIPVFLITPIRLAIPIILYSIAYLSYRRYTRTQQPVRTDACPS